MNLPTFHIRPVTNGHIVSFTGISVKSHFVAGTRDRAERDGRAHLEAHAYASEKKALKAAHQVGELQALSVHITALKAQVEQRAAQKAKLDRAMGLSPKPSAEVNTDYQQAFSACGVRK